MLAPVTSSFDDGELVPIPTLPLESIRIRSVPLVAIAAVSAAGKNTPVLLSEP
jgi:hypothetical protein